MAERRKSSLPSQIGPSGNRIPGGGEFHPQQMLNQQFGYTTKLQAPPGLHGPFMVSYGQQTVFPQQGPFPHHASTTYQQQHPHQQQQQQQFQQQQHMQFMQQHDNVHSMQFMQDAQKSPSNQSQLNLKSSEQEAKDVGSSARPSTGVVKQDNSSDGGSSKDDEASDAKKELEAIRAAHEKQVRELEERIKALEEQKSTKEVKYLRVPTSTQKKSQQKRPLEDDEEDAGNIFEGPAESDILDRCPSPAESLHSNISIKDEPEDDFEDKIPYTFHRKSKPKPKVEVDEDNIDKEIPKSDPENTKPPKAYTLSVTDFDMCIFCQTKSEMTMAYVTEDKLEDMQVLILNVDCEASWRIKDYIFDIDMFLNNIPRYHSSCLHNLMGRLRKKRKLTRNSDETDLSVCIFCQEHKCESIYDFTSNGFANLLSDLSKFDNEKIEKLNLFLNFDRIKNFVEVESAKEEFSPEKFMYHKSCRYKFIFRYRYIRKKPKIATPEPENMEESIEITPDEEIFELIAKKKRKIEDDKKKKQRKILPEPKDFNYDKCCVFCGGRNNSKNGNRVTPIKDHNIEKSKDKAEENQYFDIIKIMEHGVEHGIDLLCHDKCYSHHNYWKRKYEKKGTRENYEVAFEAVLTEIEEPMFRNGKVFDLVELREKHLDKLKELGIESDQAMCIFVKKIKDYYTFGKKSKCRVNVIPFPDNFIYSKHLSESQVAPQIIILKAYKNSEKKVVKKLSEVLPDSNNSSPTKVRKKNIRFSCTACDYKTNLQRSFIKHKRMHEDSFLTEIMCEVCGKMLKNKQTLRHHMRKHSGDKYYCLKCDKSFVSKSALNNHAVSHSGEKKEECPQCGKRFLLKKYVKHHIKSVHEPKSNEKPFLCNICGSSFRTRDGLKEHAVKHTDEKPFVCKECGKGFKYRSVRRTHMLAHEGRKPQMCCLCSFGCYTKGQLDQHMATHTGSKEHRMSYNVEKEDVKSVLERYINLDELPNVKSQTYFPL